MRITIEDVREAAMAAAELRRFLEAEGHRLGHAINACACNVCLSIRDMQNVQSNLRPMLYRHPAAEVSR